MLTNVYVLTARGGTRRGSTRGHRAASCSRGAAGVVDHRQIVGRRLRVAEGVRKVCTLVRLARAVIHGLPDEDVDLSLDGEPITAPRWRRRRAFSGYGTQRAGGSGPVAPTCPAYWEGHPRGLA